jgi:very-short-patch-repair endonuclease
LIERLRGSCENLPHPSLRATLPIFKENGEGRVGLDIVKWIMPRLYRSNPKIMHQAGELRRQTTPAEKKLWAYLRLMREDGVRFRRQHAIANYIVDFCSPQQKLIVELDGSQHLEQEDYDSERTKYLELQGYKVIRFWNNDVMNNIEGVILAITYALEEYDKAFHGD